MRPLRSVGRKGAHACVRRSGARTLIAYCQLKCSASMGPLVASFRFRSCDTPALLIRISIWSFPEVLKCSCAALMMAVTASAGLLRSACTLSHLMLWVVAKEEHNASVGAREDSEVKFRSSEQPFSARLRAIASPIPV